MQILFSIILGLTGLIGTASLASAGTHSPDEVKAFVQKAVDYMKKEGKEKAFAVFSDPKGPFVEGDLYIVVQDAVDGKFTMLAHGANKGLVGRPQVNTQDAEGKEFNRDVIAALTKDGDAVWTSYVWTNFQTKKIAKKQGYFLRVGDVVVSSGLYE